MAEHCYMTLVMSDSYLPGAMILAHSLRDTGTTTTLIALVTLDTVSLDVINELKTMYQILPIDRIANPKPANLYLMGRPDLIFTFTKIALWRQTQFAKIIYMDADMVAIQNLDHLFQLDAPFAAAPDIGWPDAFNSGFMVLTPNMGDYWALQTLAQSGDSFDGADQGLLNQYYQSKSWHRLSFTYNCTPSAEYQWEPAYRYHKSNIKAVHFIGKDKPWVKGRPQNPGDGMYRELVNHWWTTYDRHYKQAPDYVPGKSYARSYAVQQRVAGESIDMYYGVPANERLPPPSTTEIAPPLQTFEPKHPQPHHHTSSSNSYTQIPTFTVHEPTPEEAPTQGSYQPEHQPEHKPPPPYQSQPDFVAPPAEWDATRAPPPNQSRPEAAEFPSQHYTFEESRRRFRAPHVYPDAPKDMWYTVPDSRPIPEEPPKPIFPWERQQRKRPQATRIFSEDHPPSPQLDQPWSPPGTTWEENSGGMEKYIKDIMSSMSDKPKGNGVTSPLTGRRESLVFTGIPMPQDRPSLPVTPAPLVHNPFWGNEQNKTEDGKGSHNEILLNQAEWNPNERLEDLRRSSLIEIESLTKSGGQTSPIPSRPLPGVLTNIVAPQPSSASSSPLTKKGSSASKSSSQQSSPSETVSRLEAAAMKEKVIPSTDKATSTDGSQYSKVAMAIPSFDGTNDFTEEENGPTLHGSPGSFSAASALESSTISPTER